MKRTILISLFASLILSLFAPQAQALVLPPFTSCLNPQGSVKASYDSGTHGIVGDSRTYTGKDTVYYVDNNNLLQCFCDVNGNGIQTRWLKASSFTDADRKLLISQGWISVTDGSAWGLLAEAYLAKNDRYVCGGTNNYDPGEVLGLASTGNMQTIVGILSFGILALIWSNLLRKKVRS